MPVIGSYRRRRAAVYQSTRRVSAGGWKADLLHLCGSSVLMVAVVGVPDPVRTEIVKAFVLPKPDVTPTAELAAEIQAFVRDRLAAYQYPREVEFVTELPLTATGKIMRKDLRNREIAKQQGD